MATTEEINRNEEINLILKENIERAFGHRIKSPREFDALRQSIFKRTGVLLSATTLKRFWGYIIDQKSLRRSTLDVLSRYAGWSDWESLKAGMPNSEIESGPIHKRHINVAEGMTSGEALEISWLPDRTIRIEYHDNGFFEIIDAENTRLKAGDLFRCSLICEGEPLYAEHLIRDGKDLGVYLCGRKNGITVIKL